MPCFNGFSATRTNASDAAAVRGRRNSEHWVADVYLRRISPYLTRLLLRTSITANGVTWSAVTM